MFTGDRRTSFSPPDSPATPPRPQPRSTPVLRTRRCGRGSGGSPAEIAKPGCWLECSLLTIPRIVGYPSVQNSRRIESVIPRRQLLAYLRKCARAFERVDDYPLADRVLRPLFRAQRRNTDPASTLGKAVTL